MHPRLSIASRRTSQLCLSSRKTTTRRDETAGGDRKLGGMANEVSRLSLGAASDSPLSLPWILGDELALLCGHTNDVARL